VVNEVDEVDDVDDRRRRVKVIEVGRRKTDERQTRITTMIDR